MLAPTSEQEKQDAALREIIARFEQQSGWSKRMLRQLMDVADTKGGLRAQRSTKRRQYEKLYERAIKEHAAIHMELRREIRDAVRCGSEEGACTARDKMARLHHQYCRALAKELTPRGRVWVLLPRGATTLNGIVGYLIDGIGLSAKDVALLRARLSPEAPSFASSRFLSARHRAVKTAYSAHKRQLLKNTRKESARPKVKIVKKRKTLPQTA